MAARRHPARRPAPRGMALIVALGMLLTILSLGLTAVRLVSSEERMAGHAYDRALALQAAESALREAEQWVEAVRPRPATGNCADFQGPGGTPSVRACPPPAANATPRWLDSAFNGWQAASPVGTGATAITPAYFAEYLGNQFPCGQSPADPPGCSRYRITARVAGAGRASAMLQSVYATD